MLVPDSIKAFVPLGWVFKRIIDFDDEAPLALTYRARERSPCVKAFVSSVLSLYKGSEDRAVAGKHRDRFSTVSGLAYSRAFMRRQISSNAYDSTKNASNSISPLRTVTA